MVEVVSDGRRMDMEEAVSIVRSSTAIGRLMILGRVAVDCQLRRISTTVLEVVQCSACFKVGCQCLPPAQARER